MRCLALLVLAACASDPPPPTGPDVTSHITTFDIPAATAPKLDLVIVVDDSTAMQPYTARLDDVAAQLAGGAFKDLKIAIVTSSTTTLVFTPHFFMPPTQSFTGSLDDALAAALAIDATHASPPPLLARAQTALTGFARADAYLGILVLAASDDASPAADYASSFKALHADASRVFVAGIYPVGSAPNLDAFFAGFVNRNVMVSIDAQDWTLATGAFDTLYKVTLGALCLAMPLDLAPELAGDQFDCSITAEREDGSEHVLPACGSVTPCWSFRPDPQNCFEPTEATLELGGFSRHYHPAIRGQCVTK